MLSKTSRPPSPIACLTRTTCGSESSSHLALKQVSLLFPGPRPSPDALLSAWSPPLPPLNAGTPGLHAQPASIPLHFPPWLMTERLRFDRSYRQLQTIVPNLTVLTTWPLSISNLSCSCLPAGSFSSQHWTDPVTRHDLDSSPWGSNPTLCHRP